MERVQGSYWNEVWNQLLKHRLGNAALCVFFVFVFLGIYAPFFASSKPLILEYNGQWYFPLFRYLFYSEFYTKRLDIFFNILMFTLPLFLMAFKVLTGRKKLRNLVCIAIVCVQFLAFLYYGYTTPSDPASNPKLSAERQEAIKQSIHEQGQFLPSWTFELQYMNDYARLNLLTRDILRKEQNNHLEQYQGVFEKLHHRPIPTLWNMEHINEQRDIDIQQHILDTSPPESLEHKQAQFKMVYIKDRRHWIEEQSKRIFAMVNPLLSHFHWEDDAGGDQAFNQLLPWWNLTRINRKDLLSALIFGIRISLSVGVIAVFIAVLIGVPIGAFAGYYGGVCDMLTCRLLEIWESMPTFFMLLIVVAMMQSKSIFIVIIVIGLFAWTTFTRYIRGEFFKQRNLSYVESCKAQGFNDMYIIFTHILPNAIPPILTLLPFSIMSAITSEAGLSFLGLGEEGSCSWGVLMDEGRAAFPAESYLLWPPAILLTILLVAIALVGDALRDAIDPKMRKA